MSDEFDLDFNDGAFGGDIDFDDNFDMDPFKNKGFFSGATSGFLEGITDGTIGSGDAVIRTMRAILPTSYSNFLDKISYLNTKKGDLLKEFKESNYQTVRSLQSIAKNIASRIDNENSVISQKLTNFSEKDFSDWEKTDGSSSDSISMESLNQEEIDSELQKLVSSQTQIFQTISDGNNQMQAQVGGGIIAAVKGGNKELIGVQASIKELLDYQRNVQYKMDQAKVELLARTYLVNAKYYKFMESALHNAIQELKKITKHTSESDYEKTTLYNAAKASIRGGLLGAIGKRTGGLLGELKQSFGKEGRQDKYNVFESLFSNVDDALSMSEGMNVSRGMVGSLFGRMIADKVVSDLPYYLNQGPFQKLFSGMFKNNPEFQERISQGWDKVRNFGNLASYNANNGFDLLNYYAQYWEDLDEYEYENYEDYVDKTKEKGKKPMPKPIFHIVNGLGNQAKGFINNYMGMIDKSRGTQYSLTQRNAATLTKVSQWREINNITLNDVIPGWLSRIYESMERFRTGNDNFKSPVFSYNRGQFVDQKIARQIVENDVFNHSSFQNSAINARNIVNEIDNTNLLTQEQKRQLALRITQDADKEFGFNPYYYTDEIEGLDPQLQKVINGIIRNRFDIDDEKIAQYNEASMKDKIKMSALGFSGESAETLNTLGSLVKGLKESIPNIANNFTLNRQAGNEQILRDLGLIYTEDGVDKLDMSKFWERLEQYIKDPFNPQLRGDYTFSGEVNAGKTRQISQSKINHQYINHTEENKLQFPGESLQTFNSTVEAFTKTIVDFKDEMGKIDFSKVNVDLGVIPDNLSEIKSLFEKVNERDEKQYGLIEQITACVCRQAGGWGGKTDQEKKTILQEEEKGKRSILDRLKAINPRGMYNKAVETLINNQPLVLGGIIGGLGTLAIHNPKAAALLTGGIAIAGLYGRLKDLSRGETPNDDEDIYDRTGAIILHASKLRQGDYYDEMTKKVIKSWKDIKGAIKDLVTGAYTTVAQLTDKLFGPDGRAIIIKGLNKVKDALNSVWNKIDLAGNLSKAWNKGKEMFYQQDVYVKGDDEPRLKRGGFMSGKYYCYNPLSKQPFVIRGWNEIEGPVYELDGEGNLNQIISEADIAQGLMTSNGVRLDKLGKATSWLKDKTFAGLVKAKDFTLEKAGVVKDKVTEMMKDDYSSIENRIDRIYYLLCDHFNIPRSALPTGDGVPPPPPTKEYDPIEEMVEGATHTEHTNIKDVFNKESQYPEKIRLNSLLDKEQKEEKKKRNTFYEDIHSIKENIDGGLDSGKEKDEKKKGILGKLAGLLTGGFGMLKKLFTNPLGFAGDIVGGLLKSMIKSPMRLVSIGNLLFQGALGVASPIYKLMTWGFSGLMWGIRKLIWKETTESFGDWFRGRRAKGRKGRKSKGKSKGKFKINLPGRLKTVGKILAIGGTGYAAYSMFGDGNEDKVSQNIANRNEGAYNQFYEGGDDSINDVSNDDETNESEGMSDLESMAAWTIGPWAASKATGKAYEKYAATKAAKAGGLATEAAEASKAGGLGAKVLGNKLGTGVLAKGAGKLGARAIPLLGEILMALDGVMGFADGEQASSIFNTNYVNGNMRLANGITEALDLGGIVSGTMNAIADITGIESLRQEGGMTRLVDKGLELISDIPIIGLPFKLLGSIESDMSSYQRKIRLAMYGIKDTDNTLGKTIDAIERTLEQFVLFNGKEAWIDNKAPIKDLIASIVKVNPNDTVAWWKMRFEPVFKLWQSAIRMGGYNSLIEFDLDKAPKIVKIVSQLRGAVTALRPYPLDVVMIIDPETPIMNRVEAEGVIVSYFDELKKEIGDNNGDLDEKGNVKIENHIRNQKELLDNVSEETGFFASIGNFFQSANAGLEEAFYPTSADVLNIDISDLHKDEKTEVDELTLVRLAAYGNTDNNPIRIDTVLRLERYCEQFFVYQSGYVQFNGKLGDVYTLFKDSFRSTPYWENHWVTWFNYRFIPIMKRWYEEVYKLRNVAPAKGWMTLSATNKLMIASQLIDVKAVVEKESISIWDVRDSPFSGRVSGNDVNIVNSLMTNLESKAVEAKLKMPEDEAKKSKAINIQDNINEASSIEKERKLIERLKGGGGIYTTDNSINSRTAPTNTISYNNAQIGGGYGMGGGSPNDPTSQFGSTPAGDYQGKGDNNFTPNAQLTDKGFKISEKEAIKTIINEFVKQGITDNRILAFALANAKSETRFQGTAENLNYTAAKLKTTFREFIKNPQLADMYGRVDGVHPANQQKIGEIAYGTGSKAKELGNKTPQDGYRLRGRGYTQLTGRGNYEAVSRVVNDDFVNNPEKVTNDPIAAAKSAAGYFKINPAIMNAVKRGDIYGAAKKVGSYEEGARNKVRFYPEFLKRLTEGDLKGILNSSENEAKEETPTAGNLPVSEVPPDQKENVDMGPIPEVGNNPNDVVQKAANNVNAPPQIPESPEAVTLTTPSITAPNTDVAEVPVIDTPSEPDTKTDVSTTATTSVQENNLNPIPSPTPLPEPQKVTLPEGVIPVRDDAVASAIAGLADAISRTLVAQNPNRRVGLGSRN